MSVCGQAGGLGHSAVWRVIADAFRGRGRGRCGSLRNSVVRQALHRRWFITNTDCLVLRGPGPAASLTQAEVRDRDVAGGREGEREREREREGGGGGGREGDAQASAHASTRKLSEMEV